jgi:outer membrane protein assembly factor BamB
MRNATRTQGALLAGVLLLPAGGLRAQDWPQWRGPNRDNHVVGFTAPSSWPKELTKKWRVEVGIGEASPVLVGDKVYVFGRMDGDEVTRCLSAATGEEVWQDKYPAAQVRGADQGYPGPRSTPAVGDGKVVTFGVHGVLSCFDAAKGKVLWRKETEGVPRFHTSNSPLIVDGKCVVYAGGLTAFDLASGKVLWDWSGARAPYGSPVLMTADGIKQVVSPADGALVGVGLADGKLLWEVKIAGGRDYANSYSTPIIDGQTVYYFVGVRVGRGGKGGGAGGGTLALKIEKKGDEFTATELWKKPFTAHGYQVPVRKNGLLFGVTAARRNFFCLDTKTGEQLWKDSTERGDCGSILDAGPVLLALTSDKELVAFRPSRERFEEVAKYQVAESPTWCVPIVSGNRIFVKDKGGSLTLWTLD